QVRAASERTEPIKGVTMEEVVRRENLKKALKRVCANKGGNAEPFLCRKRAPFPLKSLRVFSKGRMNRRVRLPAAGRDPYARWCGRAKVVRPSPIPIMLSCFPKPIKINIYQHLSFSDFPSINFFPNFASNDNFWQVLQRSLWVPVLFC
ncbi:hypothetical protein DRN98_01515, partial [Methanosarcinales archaeon]